MCIWSFINPKDMQSFYAHKKIYSILFNGQRILLNFMNLAQILWLINNFYNLL